MTRRKDPRETRLPVTAGELPDFTPVPRQCQRDDGWTDARQRAFIEALADTGSVRAAAAAVNMSSEGAYHLRRQQGAQSFRKAWETALQLGVQRIEDVAMDRALNGVDVPVYSYGKLVGLRKSYNDRLLMFMLRNRAPDRFAEGRAKGMSGMDLTTLEREKKKWRREWELEQQANRPQVSAAEVRASIDRKIEALRRQVEAERQREWDALSEETREAWERFEALKARDLNSQHLLESGDRSAGPQGRLAARSASEDIAPAESGAENKDSSKVRRLKDEGWD
ncbi:hypothetical protein P7228_12620 [Altererythrobacter arenosus]|uniref:Terminase small subunit n=1 Tax=Altererythrobacter arenosus TaxID=3032592 RepID=A0ABY8FSH0_9SPHN|nr:hypothetical protein [Altererythrobacter sp. CAU 1644]WFL76833.1 hypothetical protein P7228_12620 [Altererythrobacter sp. CAU 1644]